MSMDCLDNFVIYLDGENHVLDLSNNLILSFALLYCHLLNVALRHNVDRVPRQLTSWMLSLGTMSMECLDNFVIYVAGKTTSWISLILFPALLYCHLLDVELRHNVDGVPRQLCHLP